MELDDRFAKAFSYFKISQKDFAKFAGYSPQYISSLINKKDPIGLKPAQQYIYPTRIAEHFRDVANQLGISPQVQFYALKDTAADKLIANGFSSKDIRDLFRHSNISITDAYLKKRNLMTNERLIKDFPRPV